MRLCLHQVQALPAKEGGVWYIYHVHDEIYPDAIMVILLSSFPPIHPPHPILPTQEEKEDALVQWCNQLSMWDGCHWMTKYSSTWFYPSLSVFPNSFWFSWQLVHIFSLEFQFYSHMCSICPVTFIVSWLHLSQFSTVWPLEHVYKNKGKNGMV